MKTCKMFIAEKILGQGDRYIVPGNLTKKTSFEDNLSGVFCLKECGKV